MLIVTGGRSHSDLVCWDLRHTRSELGRVKRALNSNQKMTFAIDPWGKYLATGTQDGKYVLRFDARTLLFCFLCTAISSSSLYGTQWCNVIQYNAMYPVVFCSMSWHVFTDSLFLFTRTLHPIMLFCPLSGFSKHFETHTISFKYVSKICWHGE